MDTFLQIIVHLFFKDDHIVNYNNKRFNIDIACKLRFFSTMHCLFLEKEGKHAHLTMNILRKIRFVIFLFSICIFI